MNIRRAIEVFILLTFLVSCLDPYQPPVSHESTNYLIVDGFINTTDNSVSVNLSRAIALSDTASYPKEVGAKVTIQHENGQITLYETEPGVYTAQYAFEYEKDYQLKIITGNDLIASKSIQLRKSADIDSITYRADDSDLQVLAYSHDFSPGKKYYRYNYDETFEYTASLNSSYIFQDGIIVARPNNDLIYKCWLTQKSTSILVVSTENFSQNIINAFEIARMAKGDRRLWSQYSILVRQLSIDQEAYNYWLQLQKFTESLGGLFDPIPATLQGNLYSIINPGETVLGYFSGGSVDKKRIVFDYRDLPKGYNGRATGNCEQIYIEVKGVKSYDGSSYLIISSEVNANGDIVGYYFSEPQCADCRTQGGTTIKPDFMK